MDWKIQTHSKICHGCREPFQDEQRYHTILEEIDREWRRTDLCAACWDALPKPDDAPSTAPADNQEPTKPTDTWVSNWSAIHKAPPRPEEGPIQKETAESLLKRLVEANEPHRVGTRYILAAMLERQRRLKLRDTLKKEGGRVFLYEIPKTQEMMAIEDVRLSPKELAAVSEDVAQLLDGPGDEPETAEDAQEPVANEAE